LKIAFISLPLSGHLNPMTALAHKLKKRGHEVSFIGIADSEASVRAVGLDFVSFCEKEYPLGSNLYGPTAGLHGLDVVRCACQVILPPFIKASLERLPEKLAGAGFDLLVIDTIYFFIELVPMSLGIPYVHVSNVLAVDGSGVTPASFFDSRLDVSQEAQELNLQALKQLAETLFPSILEVVIPQAAKLGLNINWHDRGATVSKLAVIAQYPEEFDFPGVPKPSTFHYSGPFHQDELRETFAFPWEQLTGKPLVYASMGTLLNGASEVFKIILESVARMPEIEVVLSVGNNINIDDLGPIPSHTIVVHRAPQIELLKRASLCITHAGLNTVLESLAQGVPMVAIPVGFDQPGVAARIAHHGLGEFVGVDETLSANRLDELVRKVMGEPSYRERARYFQNLIARSNGLEEAANLVEKAHEAATSKRLPS
jgi:zeaxanthin glucosyltransferase